MTDPTLKTKKKQLVSDHNEVFIYFFIAFYWAGFTVACTQALILGRDVLSIARSKHMGLGRARERKSLQPSLYDLRSTPCSAWLICQIIKVEWANQKKTGNDPLGQCSFNGEAVKTQFSCPLHKIHNIFIIQLKCYGAHFISNNKAAKKRFKVFLEM